MNPISVTEEQLTQGGPALLEFLEPLARTGRVFFVGDDLVALTATSTLRTSRRNPTQALLEAGLVRFESKNGQPAALTNWARLQTALNTRLSDPVARTTLPTVGRIQYLPALGPDPLAAERLVRMQPGLYLAVDGPVLFVGQWPSLPEADPAYPHLNTWLTGLCLRSPNSAHFLRGWAAAALCRAFLRDFPVLLIDAPKKSCGKTRLAQALSVLLCGQETASLQYTGDEGEMERRIATIPDRAGPNLIVIDNIRPKQGQIRSVRSQLLSSAATSHCVYGRRMHHGPHPLFSPLFVATMNAGQVEPDLADKTWRVCLTRPAGTAHRRLEPDPLAYAHAHRLALLSELVDLLTSLPLARADAFHTRFYGAETILRTVAAALDPTGFDHHVETPDAAVRQLYHVLRDNGGTLPVQALLDLIEREAARVRDLAELVGGLERTSRGRVGAFVDLLTDFYIGQDFLVDTHRFRFILGESNISLQEPLSAEAETTPPTA